MGGSEIIYNTKKYYRVKVKYNLVKETYTSKSQMFMKHVSKLY